MKTGPDGKQSPPAYFSGKTNSALAAGPGPGEGRLWAPIQLFNGKNLNGWKLIPPDAVNGWSVKDGLLVNTLPREPHKRTGNLRTVREFEDFRITADVNVPKDGNSGVYLRGIYEVQVFDSFGKPVDCHNIGAIYSRITPSAAVERPAGEWQTLDITLVDRHATVILNGTKIIDNKPLLGCTGGALVRPVSPRSDLPARRSHGRDLWEDRPLAGGEVGGRRRRL